MGTLIKKGYIEEVTPEMTLQGQLHYVPYSFVTTQKGSSLKLRIVLDFSCKTETLNCVNDMTIEGPDVYMEYLAAIIMITRCSVENSGAVYILTADIEGCFNQMEVDEATRN